MLKHVGDLPPARFIVLALSDAEFRSAASVRPLPMGEIPTLDSGFSLSEYGGLDLAQMVE